MNAKDLIELLRESSSLRPDLLEKVMGCIKETFDKIELTDEVCARVSDETYEFIKSYKEGK